MPLAYDLARKMFEGVLPSGVDFMPLGDFQTQTVDKVTSIGSHIIGLPMGTGKTPMTVQIMERQRHKSALILPTGRALVSWLKTMWLWHPEYLRRFIVIDKSYDKATRAAFWESHRKRRDVHVICNWQLASRDLVKRDEDGKINVTADMPHFDVVACDEYHKFMRNRDTKAHKLLKGLGKDTVKLMVSGSPMSKGPIDLFIPFQLFDPRLFSSYWKFAATWCYIDETGHGKQVYGARNVEAFRRMASRYMVIATKKQLGIQKKIREVFPVEMTPLQANAYEQARDGMMIDLEDGPPVLMLNSMVTWIKLRQVLCCPAMVAPELGSGGGALSIYDTLADLPREERHALIFVPFRGAIPPLRAIFEGRGARNGIMDAPDQGLDVPVFEFSGGLTTLELHTRLQEFKRTRGLGICTVDYAESWDAETVDKCWFLGASPDPQVNFQAEDRLDRINNEAGIINCYYVSHEDTVDDSIMANLVYKQENVRAILEGRTNMLRALKG